MKKRIIIQSLSLLVFTAITSCGFNKDVKYKFIGKYAYEITDKNLFEKTYLYDSYGFLIGDLDIQGIKIQGIDSLVQTKDYIVSISYPIKNVYKNSEKIRNEGQEHTSKRPLEIIQNKEEFSNSIYVYELESKGKYRLLLP